MSNAFDLQKWLAAARSNWAVMAQAAVWLITIVGAFVFLPADIATEDNKAYKNLARFIVAVVVGIFIVVSNRWHRKKHARIWAIVTALFLVFSVVVFDRYQKHLKTSMCQYSGHLIIVGTVYTSVAQNYMNKHRYVSCENLIMAGAGKIEDIWTKDSIDAQRLALLRMYLLCVTLFGLSVLTVIQALSCLAQGKKNQSKGAS